MLMELPNLLMKHGLFGKISGVVHIGAHTAEEAPIYASMGIPDVWWIEANPELIPEIQRNLQPYGNQWIINALISEIDYALSTFHITNNNGLSSSLFEFGTHPQFSPEVVYTHDLKLITRTLDGIVPEFLIHDANFLNMDLQGAELLALRGAQKFLNGVDAIYTEINRAQVYIGCAQVFELQSFLEPYGFALVDEYWVPGQDWGDGLFKKVR